MGVTVEEMIRRSLARCSVRLVAACIEFVYKCSSAFHPARPVDSENLSSVCRHLLSLS